MGTRGVMTSSHPLTHASGKEKRMSTKQSSIVIPPGLRRSLTIAVSGTGEYVAPRTMLQPGAITRQIWMRFLSYTAMGAPCYCQGAPHRTWLWLGKRDKDGYGEFWWKGRDYRAHRFAYIALRGSIPDDLVPDHVCRIPGCVNPACLDIVTEKQNFLRGVGPAAQNARKTHCKRGHLLEGANLTTAPSHRGHRNCRICFNKLQLERYYRRKQRRAKHC